MFCKPPQPHPNARSVAQEKKDGRRRSSGDMWECCAGLANKSNMTVSGMLELGRGRARGAELKLVTSEFQNMQEIINYTLRAHVPVQYMRLALKHSFRVVIWIFAVLSEALDPLQDPQNPAIEPLWPFIVGI